MSNVIALPRRTHAITIEVEPFGYGFDVRVLPPPAGVGHDREFRTIAEAQAYAGQLARATGWSVVDHSGEGDAG